MDEGRYQGERDERHTREMLGGEKRDEDEKSSKSSKMKVCVCEGAGRFRGK